MHVKIFSAYHDHILNHFLLGSAAEDKKKPVKAYMKKNIW